MINDMDAKHDYIVTCGYSLRMPQQVYMLDSFVQVFNLKTMAQTNPIPFPHGAAFVRLHPRMSTTIIIVSSGGLLHVTDLANVDTSNLTQANVLSYLSMAEIAPSGEAMVLTDVECYAHIWGSKDRIHYAETSIPIEFAQPQEQLHAEWSDDR